MRPSYKNILSGSVWGIFAKTLDALAKFVTIPLLVGFYGKDDYGLIALAFSLNTYLRLMDMGMNVGSIRFFSIWISEEKWHKISSASRSSMVFYGAIGFINASIFVYMANYAGGFFNLTAEQIPVFKWIMYILSISTILNWTSNVINQLLSAHGEIGWVNRVTVLSSIFNFVTALMAIKLNLSLPVYFFFYTLSTLMVIPLNIYRLNVYNMPLWRLLAPKWNGKAFKVILTYSVAIFAMGIFQLSADSLRPILLGKFASKGVEVLTEYRVLQTLVMLVVAFGGVFMQVLLPSASKIYAEQNESKIKDLVYEGTKYITIFLSFIVFLLITNSETLLVVYMGKEYADLSIWLVVWLLTVLLVMHNTPVASLVLSSGKTRFLVYSSAFSCLFSLPITGLLASRLNVGAAVTGYFVYVVLQISFYYFYYTPKVLKLDSFRIFTYSFAPALMCGFISSLFTHIISGLINIQQGYFSMVTASVLYTLIFGFFVLVFVMRPKEIMKIKRKIIVNV